MRVEHTPERHDCVSGHGDGAKLSPSAAQVSRPVSEPGTQRVLPGVQTRGRHAPPEQVSVAAHTVVTYDCPSAEQT